MKKHTVVYPGSFDPITLGHVDLVYRALNMFDRIIIAVAVNTSKKSLFTIEERIALIRETFADQADRIEIDGFEGLLVDYLKQRGLNTVLRGLRAISDFDYEFQIATMNRNLNPDIDTIFLMTSQKYFYLSSSILKEVARFEGDVSRFVPEAVAKALKQKLKG